MGFIHALPTETTLRLWDLLLLHGAAALFAASLATLRAVASPLASAVPGDFEACWTGTYQPEDCCPTRARCEFLGSAFLVRGAESSER